MAYTKKFVNPHPNGWDNPSERPPITADVLQAHTDAIQAIDNYLAAGGGGGGGGSDYVLPVATSTILGGVKVDGDTIAVTADGTISVTAEVGAIKNTSDLINDGSGSNSYFIEASELAQVAFTGQYSDLKNKITKTSQLTNDSNFLSTIPKATTTTLGGIKLDGETLSMNSDGVVSVSIGAGGSSFLADLEDTNIKTPIDKQFLIYNEEESKWLNQTLNIPNSLTDLDNVDLPSEMIQDGDVLTYNSESSTWVNQAIDLGAGSRELTLAEYDALTAEQKADGTDYYITDAEEMDELLVSTSNTYSLDEKVVGRWINGKPIYQMTICLENGIINNGQIVVPIDILYLDIVLNYSSIIYDNLNNAWMPMPFAHSQFPITFYCDLGVGGIVYNFASAYSPSDRITKIYTTIQYTKTIDLIPSEFSYEGAYSDSSPVTYTFDREMILAGIKVKCPGVKGTSGLWQPGTVTYEVQLEEDGDWVTILTDTSSTEGVWGGSGNGNFTYNREYILPKYLEVYGLRITFTGVYRVSADITVTEMVS